MKRAILLSIALLFALGLSGCSYNDLTAKQQVVKTKWSAVESAMQRRADLIPNLVATVKGAADFEKSTYIQVAQARAGQLRNLTNVPADSLTPARMQQIQEANAQSSQAMRSAINIAIEAYPQLKATQNFSDLQTQLEGTENRINVSRNGFNDAVQNYNQKVTSFPNNIMAKIFGFQSRPMFQADPNAQNAPKVQF